MDGDGPHKSAYFPDKSTVAQISASVAAALLLAAGFFVWQQTQQPERPAFTQSYRLVQEKVSESAMIAINLPPDTDKARARNNISFTPQVEGEWIGTEEPDKLVFNPETSLQKDRWYEASLTTEEGGVVRSEFKAVNDPTIQAVFPENDAEAPADTEITIVFTRPMVPLTTLQQTEQGDIPVEITPETEGRFKWTSTRNLQFIPEEQLHRSTTYTVRVKEGMTSMDGLPVRGGTYTFTTRHLRYERVSEGKTVYNQPVTVRFNQPVDVERTKSEITVSDKETGNEIPVIVRQERLSQDPASDEETGRKRKRDRFTRFADKLSASFGDNIRNVTAGIGVFGGTDNADDASTIYIYNKKDRFGRSGLWGFGKRYRVRIDKAFPAEGDIAVEQPKRSSIAVTQPIKNVSAESGRTDHASLDFFDPQGKLIVDFYESVDKDRTNIDAPHLSDVRYGKKCREESAQLGSDVECEKVADKTRLILTFDAEAFNRGEQFPLVFRRITTESGLHVNREPIRRQVTTYPQFAMRRVAPSQGISSANLTELTVCSNTPIAVPAEEDRQEALRADQPYEIQRWHSSWRVEEWHLDNKDEECRMGEFHTTINYGLMPQTEYSLRLDVQDVFGQRQQKSWTFATGGMPNQKVNIFRLYEPYSVTSPDRTELTYASENITSATVNICKVSAPTFLKTLHDEPHIDESPATIRGCSRRVTDTIELPQRYWIKNYFKIDIAEYFSDDPRGHYIVSVSNPKYTYYGGGQAYEYSMVTITNIAAAQKNIDQRVSSDVSSPEKFGDVRNMYWVTNMSDTRPVSEATVTQYHGRQSLRRGDTTQTNKNGIARLSSGTEVAGAVVRSGTDSTVITGGESSLDYARSASAEETAYIYSDKPIYQPNQTVHIKAIHRLGYDGNYRQPASEDVDITVENSRGKDVLERAVPVNTFGTATTSFHIAQDAPLGTYRVCLEGAECSTFDVEEYVPAPFEVSVGTEQDEYISQDTVAINFDASYFFGVPVQGGEVEWSISSQNYYFDGVAGKSGGRSPYRRRGYGDKFLMRGNTALSEDGTATVKKSLDISRMFSDTEERQSKILVVRATVKNQQGKSVSAQHSFVLHAGEFYLQADAERRFAGTGEQVPVTITSFNTTGEKRGVGGGTFTAYRTEWTRAKRLGSDGGYHYQWEKKRERVHRTSFSTGSDGTFRDTMEFSQTGRYEIVAEATDSRGNTVRNTTYTYISGEEAVRMRTGQDTDLELEAENTTVEVGETGNIIIQSPFEQSTALIALERGEIFTHRVEQVDGSFHRVSIPIKEEYAPNVYATVLLHGNGPAVKFGKVEFSVDTEQKEINVNLGTDKEAYLPGEEVTVNATATDHQGEPVDAELSLSVADLSVLALKGNPKKDPVTFFYGGFPLTVSTASNIKNILTEIDIPTKGGGGGQGKLRTKKRGEFREVAFWGSSIRTGEDGRATVSFTLPDNLTRWQLESVGVTEDTRVGAAYQEITARKEMMITPLVPRFVVPGDEFLLGAQIFNQDEAKQSLTVAFSSDSLSYPEKASERRVTIPAGEDKTVYFQVEAPPDMEEGPHRFTISATGAGVEDTVEKEVSITPNQTYETTATAQRTTQDVSKEYVYLPENVVRDKGKLTIQSSATLGVFLSDALNSLVEFPYGCSEQVASKLNAIAIVKRGLQLEHVGEAFQLDTVTYKGAEYTPDELVQVGLAELADKQNSNGGFGYWSGGESSFYLTLHAIETLHNLQQAGYQIDEDMLTQATSFINTYYRNEFRGRLDDSKRTLIETARILALMDRIDNEQWLKERIRDIASDEQFIADTAGNDVLASLAETLSRGNFDGALQETVFATLENRVEVDARGAFLDEGENASWRSYETPIKNTARYLKALSLAERDTAITEKVLRWLLRSRAKDGGWGSTHNTLTAVDSLVSYLEWSGETKSHFAMSLEVNGDTVRTEEFSSENILKQTKDTVAIEDLPIGENNKVIFRKENKNLRANPLYYDLSLKYYLPLSQVPPRDEGFTVERSFYRKDDRSGKEPVNSATVGEVLRAHLEVTVPEARHFVAIEDFLPAGVEPINFDFATEQKESVVGTTTTASRFDNTLRPDFKEMRDDRVFLYEKRLSPGVYEFDYYVRTLVPGKFRRLPAVAKEWYLPENFGRTAGNIFTVERESSGALFSE